MTLIELVFVVFYLSIGILCGNYGYIRFGWIGLLAGFCFGVLITIGFVKLLVYINSIFHRPLPICHNGICQGKDYLFIHNRMGKVVCRCKCGKEYILEGRRFSEVSADGRIRPYMKRSLSGKWVSDSE